MDAARTIRTEAAKRAGDEAARVTPIAADEVGRVTPMMEQYIEIKAANPDCLLFYRMGDFYELFFDDAEVASRALGIVLTKRGKHLGADIPMCGVPIERADEYLHRLIALGHRVAVCEQLEDPAAARKRGGKSVVRRDVVRLVTPGTLTEDLLLDAKRNNYPRRAGAEPRFGRRGSFRAGLDRHIDRRIPRRRMRARRARRRHRPDRAGRNHRLRCALCRCRARADAARLPALTPLTRDVFDGATAERRLAGFFGVATTAAFGAFSRVELAAAAAAVTYVERTQIGKRPPLSAPVREAAGATLAIDSGDPQQSRTHAHARRRTARLAPCRHRPHHHRGRLAAIGAAARCAADRRRRDRASARRGRCFHRDAAARSDLRARLKSAPDLARALSRIVIGRGGPRDLAAIRDGIFAAAEFAARLSALPELPRDIAQVAQVLRRTDAALAEELGNALADELPHLRRDGGFVRAGYAAALDEARALRDESRRVIAALQVRYAEDDRHPRAQDPAQ